MTYTKYLPFLGIFLFFLAGCSNNTDYIKDSESIPPLRTAPGIPLKPAQTYYPIPNTTSANQTAAPSQVPPGSDIERFKTSQNTSSATSQTMQVAQAKSVSTSAAALGSTRIGLNADINKAWTQVGKALSKTPYQILDQDNAVYSYFVLDKSSTENKITRSTPIYRVHLESSGNTTNVVLLDQENKPASSEASARILGAIKQSL